jgi:hypothetical protein
MTHAALPIDRTRPVTAWIGIELASDGARISQRTA